MIESEDIIFVNGDKPKIDNSPALESRSTVSVELERELTAASSIPDKLTVVPTKGRPTSMIGMIVSLDVGDVFTKSEFILEVSDLDAMSESVDLTARKEKLRQSVKASMTHAKKKTNGEYTLETHHFITPLGRLYIQVLVTRIS